MTKVEEAAIHSLLTALEAKYGNFIQQVVIFGSKARGDSNADSDIDLLVVVESEDWAQWRNIWQTVGRIELEFDVFFNVHLVSAPGWQQMGEEQFSLYRNVSREGITLFRA